LTLVKSYFKIFVVAQRKPLRMDNQRKPAFGWFVGAVAHSEDPQMSEPEPEDPEEFVRGMQKAAERVFLPRRMDELGAQMAELKKEQRGRFRSNKKNLRFYIQVAKRAAVQSGNLDYSQLEIAESVDRLLAAERKNFPQVCLESWRKQSPPRLFADIFRTPNHPLLKLAKPYITKTKV